jgi:integrase
MLDDYAFPSRTDHARHISTRQYARLVDEWVTAIGLRREDYGTHSLRRTKASIIYKATGNLRTVPLLLGHTKIESKVRYLAVNVEDALALAEHAPRSLLVVSTGAHRCCRASGAAVIVHPKCPDGHSIW